ncbi:MAG: indolepyruvate ferredoxin oxidoreductase subunit alpha [Candidatus Helarchaeota archaeon]
MLVPFEKVIHKLEGDQGDFIKVNQENCVACKKCLIVCPVNLWYMKDGKANIRENYKDICLECGSCWQVCDYNAIIFTYPKGGTGVIFRRG